MALLGRRRPFSQADTLLGEATHLKPFVHVLLADPLAKRLRILRIRSQTLDPQAVAGQARSVIVGVSFTAGAERNAFMLRGSRVANR